MGEEQRGIRAHGAQARVDDLRHARGLELRARDGVEGQVAVAAAGVVRREARVDLLADLVAAAAGGPIQAALGPSARGCCYEVGEEVHEVFERYDARVGERNLDLANVASTQLREAGVDAVHDVGLCAMCWFGLFFSHRRDNGVTGRQAGVVWRA